LAVFPLCGESTRATPPQPPPDWAIHEFSKGNLVEGRKIALERVASNLKRVTEDAPIKTLDASVKDRGLFLLEALDAVSAWAQAEASVIYREGKADENFVERGWTPMLEQAKSIITRLDAMGKQVEKLLGDAGEDAVSWKGRLSDWQATRDITVFRLALLAKMAGDPDLVKQVFEFSKPIGSSKSAEEFLAAKQDLHVLKINSEPPSLSPDQEETVRRLLVKWMTAVEEGDRKSFAALYEDQDAAQRLLESGLFQDFKYRKVNPLKGTLTATKLADGVIYLSLACPATSAKGDDSEYRGFFTLVPKGESWLFRVRDDNGLNRNQEEEIKKLIARWFEAVLAKDAKKASSLYRDQDAAAKEINQGIKEMDGVARVDIKSAGYEFERQADGSYSVFVERYIITDKEGGRKPGGHDFIVVRSDGEFKLGVANEETK
jgi:hypothetical protein